MAVLYHPETYSNNPRENLIINVIVADLEAKGVDIRDKTNYNYNKQEAFIEYTKFPEYRTYAHNNFKYAMNPELLEIYNSAKDVLQRIYWNPLLEGLPIFGLKDKIKNSNSAESKDNDNTKDRILTQIISFLGFNTVEPNTTNNNAYWLDIIKRTIETDLSDNEVDLSQKDCYKHPKFKKYELYFTYILPRYITDIWLVEKHVVEQSRLEEIYGPYMLGIERKLTEEENKYKTLYEALDDIYPYNSPAKNKCCDNANGNPSERGTGLYGRLKQIGFDIKSFNNKREKLKLIYLLYGFEIDNEIHLNLILNNPTLENEITFTGNTTYGPYIHHLATSIARELSYEDIFYIMNSVTIVNKTWIQQINILNISKHNLLNLEPDQLDNLSARIKEVPEFINKLSNQFSPDKDSPLKAFYFMLRKYENIGRIRDIMDINAHPEIISDFHLRGLTPEELHEEYLENEQWLLQHIERTENAIKSFFMDESNNKKLISILFKGKKNNVSRDYNSVKSIAIDLITTIINDDYKNNGIPVFDYISILYILSVMRIIISESKKDKMPNKFYNYTNKGKKTLHQELKNLKNAYIKNYQTIQIRINRLMSIYVNKPKKDPVLQEIENTLDQITLNLLAINNPDDMLYMNSVAYMLYCDAYTSSDDINFIIEHYNPLGYKFIIDGPEIYFLFSAIINGVADIKDEADYIESLIKNSIKKKTPYIPLQYDSLPRGACLKIILKLDHTNKLIKVSDLKISKQPKPPSITDILSKYNKP